AGRHLVPSTLGSSTTQVFSLYSYDKLRRAVGKKSSVPSGQCYLFGFCSFHLY
ncbi:hypothetical protein MKW92_010910, partial [Papaver armeniacum]